MSKELFICELNGNHYGHGDIDYMRELFTDYFVTMDMYGRSEADFKIIRTRKGNKDEGK